MEKGPVREGLETGAQQRAHCGAQGRGGEAVIVGLTEISMPEPSSLWEALRQVGEAPALAVLRPCPSRARTSLCPLR